MAVLRRAIFWGVWSALLAMPLLGARLQQDGTELLLQWRPMLVFAAGVVGAVVGGFFSQPVLAGLHRLYRGMMSMADRSLQGRYGALRAPAWFDPAKSQYLLLLVLIGAAAAFPFFASRGSLSFATLALLYVILGLGLNVVVGLAGLLDLGYVAFYAVGAYLYAMLSVYLGWSFWICLPLAGVAAALVGILLGFPVLRLRGDYLAIATLGFGEIVRILLNNLDEYTGGPDGIGGIPKPSFLGLEFTRRPSEGATSFHDFFGLDFDGGHSRVFLYLLILAMAVITYLVVRRLQRLPVGRAWEALREDEIACRSLGLNRTSIKLSAFAIGASFGGFAGCFYAALQGHINPESFIFLESVIVLAIVVLGGMGSQAGIIIAAMLVTYLQLSGLFQEYRMLVFGLAMLLMITWRPQGLIPAKRPRLELRR